MIQRFQYILLAIGAIAGSWTPVSAVDLLKPTSRWSVFVSADAVQPVGLMDNSFGISPALSVGVRRDASGRAYRVSATYSGYHCIIDTIGGTAHHASITGDVILPCPFGIPRTSVIGGLGLGVRRLREGRDRDFEVVGYGGYTRTEIIRVAFDKVVPDLVGRVGLAVDIVRTANWTLSTEIMYQAAYGLHNPEGVTLDLRADETLIFGLVLRRAFN